MFSQFTDDDIGKRVVNANGDEVGMVADVDHGTAHVEPDPGITDSIKATLGWSASGESTYPLQAAAVSRVTDDEVHLETELSGHNTGATGGLDHETGTEDRGIDRDEDDISGRDDEGVIRDDDDGPMGDDTR
ncbi:MULTISPECIES: hypothetical protein [Natrinema]|uniref:PRC-barrel domain protein n=1 Tax=Natrinema gari JCM 14663 TaxID=1230459 RepID=L9YRN1_9EURY|nr:MULTISPECIES: hypothetical protein [Natrinema]AFO58672.1 hypothetical protein NJ7G_3454 [Natrinema sp. J7-2]ELY75543.1 hypothetical protein C486_20133 [Natrinema gari JCM 14663]